MELSEDTLAVIDFLEQLSEGGLRKKNDIGIILEISASSGNYQLVNQIVFCGKSVYNLYKTLKRAQDSSPDAVQNQLLQSADELKALLDSAVPAEFATERKRFEVTYLSDTSGAFANIVDLSHDLSVFKEAQKLRNEFIKNQENDLR